MRETLLKEIRPKVLRLKEIRRIGTLQEQNSLENLMQANLADAILVDENLGAGKFFQLKFYRHKYGKYHNNSSCRFCSGKFTENSFTLMTVLFIDPVKVSSSLLCYDFISFRYSQLVACYNFYNFVH